MINQNTQQRRGDADGHSDAETLMLHFLCKMCRQKTRQVTFPRRPFNAVNYSVIDSVNLVSQHAGLLCTVMFYHSLYCIIPCCILTSCRVMSRAAMFRRRCLFRAEFWFVLPRHVLFSAALYYVILFCSILSTPVSSCYVLFFNIVQSFFYRLLSYPFLCCHVVSFAVLFFPIRLNSGMPSVVMSYYVWCAAVLSWFFSQWFVMSWLVLSCSVLCCHVSCRTFPSCRFF